MCLEKHGMQQPHQQHQHQQYRQLQRRRRQLQLAWRVAGRRRKTSRPRWLDGGGRSGMAISTPPRMGIEQGLLRPGGRQMRFADLSGVSRPVSCGSPLCAQSK